METVFDEVRVFESVVWSDSLFWVLDKHQGHQVSSFWGETLKSLEFIVRLLLFDVLEGGFPVLSLEWKLPAYQGVENNSS